MDLVFFINGLPVATAELKTDFTQTITDAINQYKATRQPKDAASGKCSAAVRVRGPGAGAFRGHGGRGMDDDRPRR